MPWRGSAIVKRRAVKLRNRQTKAELVLWQSLRRKQLAGMRFRRQYVVGRFIVDFCCVEKMLVVEVDGYSHLEQQEYDEMRTGHLKRQGYTVLRFWNNEVMNDLEAVLQVISTAAPTPALPRGAQGRE